MKRLLTEPVFWLVLVLIFAAAGFYGLNRPLNSGAASAKVGESTRPSSLPEDVWAPYHQAQKRMASGDFMSAQNLLVQTVERLGDFTEAWYNLGAAQGKLAILSMRQGDEARSIEWFRRAVASKHRAHELMLANRWYVYDLNEQQLVQRETEKTLQDSEAVMADENSIRFALKAWAGGQK